MLNSSEKAYLMALQALKARNYQQAAQQFDRAADFFKENKEFLILRETTKLLLEVKSQLGEPIPSSASDDTLDIDSLEIEEVFTDN